MTREIALHCMKSASELERELCEECPIYGQTGCDHCYEDALQYVIGMLEQEPTTKNALGVDCISREQALVAIRNLYPGMPRVDFNGSLRKWADKYKPYIECDNAIKALPSVTPQEPQTFKWCTDCKEYDQEKHCCHRWSKVIRDTVEEMKQEQEPILDKIIAEIENDWQLKKYPSSPFSCGLRRAIEIIDKYKAEVVAKEIDKFK